MHRRCALGFLFATNLIAGCAGITPAKGQFGSKNSGDDAFWSGRLALTVEGQAQPLFASFELQGRAAQGSLSLFSPVSTVAVMNWSPQEAVLRSSGSGSTPPRRFASLDDMLMEVSGAPLPVAALFEWLGGRHAVAPGWTVDLSQQPTGRIIANRKLPAPALELRVVLEKE